MPKLTIMNDQDLKKEWLAHEFTSFDYHEEMLKEYWAAIDILDRHWNDPKMASKEAQGEYAGSEKPHEWMGITSVMRRVGLRQLKAITRPNQLSRSGWKGCDRGICARAITYNFGGRGLGDILGHISETFGMDGNEAKIYGAHIHRALQMVRNIATALDVADRDCLMDEQYTGLIHWRANWKEEICSVLGVSTEGHPRGNDARCEANQPCPHTGIWWAPARKRSRRYFNQGEIMPAFSDSVDGATIWYWDESQG